MTAAVLIETSFADAIAIIMAATELTEQTRRHWTTSLRQIAKALDKRPEVIPSRYSAVRADIAQLHHVPTECDSRDAAAAGCEYRSRLLRAEFSAASH